MIRLPSCSELGLMWCCIQGPCRNHTHLSCAVQTVARSGVPGRKQTRTQEVADVTEEDDF